MAETDTPRLALRQWGAGTDGPSRAELNTSFANLEAKAAGFIDTMPRPAAAAALEGFFHYNPTTEAVSYCDGAQWLPILMRSEIFDAAGTLTNDTPNAANSWEDWGGAGERLTFADPPAVPIVVKAWLHGNLNGDSLAEARWGEIRLECSFDAGATWQLAFGGIGPRGEVSPEAGEARAFLGGFGRWAGTPTDDIVVRARMRSDGTSMLFANGYLMAEGRVQ